MRLERIYLSAILLLNICEGQNFSNFQLIGHFQSSQGLLLQLADEELAGYPRSRKTCSLALGLHTLKSAEVVMAYALEQIAEAWRDCFRC